LLADQEGNALYFSGRNKSSGIGVSKSRKYFQTCSELRSEVFLRKEGARTALRDCDELAGG
jgi:hypothetical protein